MRRGEVREAGDVVLIGVSREEANRELSDAGVCCVLVRARFRIRRPRLGDVRSSAAIVSWSRDVLVCVRESEREEE